MASLFAYAAALGLAVAIPGPGVAALVGQSMGRGLQSALCLMAGIVLGDVVYLTVAIAGFAAIAQTFAGVILLVKITGGAYLIYLSVKLWTGPTDPSRIAASRGQSGLGTVLAGFSLTLGNPKTIIFYLALLPTVLDLDKIDLAQWALLVAITICVLTAILTPYALLASRARGLMQSPGALRLTNRIAAGIIGATGLLIMAEAAATLTGQS
ncbi:lysine transporter LysE [Gemmobacter aquarius]|uniref:Lysine transporter LysE n=1 Tax=Paragemmobacter aquarius TaxID=2169400 RepID=A0A2S0UNU7_9RHOB|nr:LysE family translocator [Gemmobacter aquarius]AWB49460.1 lysine transporter LysE [Gemmobacter aquarius]